MSKATELIESLIESSKLKWKRLDTTHYASSDGRWEIGKGPRGWWLEDLTGEKDTEQFQSLKVAKSAAEDYPKS